MLPDTHTDQFFKAACAVFQHRYLTSRIEHLAIELSKLEGRLFILGVGGSAGNASHAVNDFRKLCNIEAYAPTDNVSELTARTNDEGWPSVFAGWLKVSRFNEKDALLIFSVGGGHEEKNISVNLIEAIKFAKHVKAKVFGILGSNQGYTAKNANIAICVPVIEEEWMTPIAEAFQSVIWHCLVSHPLLQRNKTKW